MKIMLKLTCAVIIIVQLFSITSASAIEWTYEQIIGFIDSITVDDNKVFSDKQYATFNGPSSDSFFTMKGAVLFWFYDTNHGEFWLFNKDEKSLCVWNKVEKRYYDSLMSVLITFLSDYVDFNKGGKITFIITSEKNFTNPFMQMEYSKISDRNGTVYTNSDKFCEDIKMVVNSTFLAD